MSTNIINPTQADSFIPEVWANRALTMLEAELHLAKNVARDSEFTTAKVGDKINIPKTGALTANQKVSGTAVTLQNPADDSVTVTLDQHYEVSFIVDDVLKAQANQDVMDRYLSDAVIALAEKIEVSLAGLYGSLTGTAINTGGGDIEDADLLSARSELTTNRAPRSNRFLYLAPDQINVMLKLDKFTSVAQYGSGQPVQQGEFGSIYGFRVFESLFVQSSGSPAVDNNLALHRDALVLAMRPLPQPKAKGVEYAVVDYQGLMLRVLYSYNAQELGDQLTIDALWGVNTLRSDLGCIINS